MRLTLDYTEDIDVKIGDEIFTVQRYNDNLLITNSKCKQLEINIKNMSVLK